TRLATAVVGWLESRSAAGSCRTEECYPSGRKHGRKRGGERWSMNAPGADAAGGASGRTPWVPAARLATTTIPTVFFVAADPVQLGLVTSLSRPEGNLTGVVTLNVEVAAKRLQLLHELVPTATIVALLVNPSNTALAETITKELEAAARTLGVQLHVLHASSERELDTAFATLVQLRAGALVIGADPCFNSG